jgi:hypothetical protein
MPVAPLGPVVPVRPVGPVTPVAPLEVALVNTVLSENFINVTGVLLYIPGFSIDLNLYVEVGIISQ